MAKELEIFEGVIETINESNVRKTYTIISADHGLLNVDNESRYYLEYPDTVEIFGDQRAVYANGTEEKLKSIRKSSSEFLPNDQLQLFLGQVRENIWKDSFQTFVF